jgi:2-oxoglutarate dehydrogenase E2 component (dihydrolipoamide succinyltransferase)
MIDVPIPQVGESIAEVQIGRWLVKEGDWVDVGQDLAELETEKASVLLIASAAGHLRNIRKKQEEFATVGEVVAQIEPSVRHPEKAAPSSGVNSPVAEAAVEPPRVMPAADRLLQESQLEASSVKATGPGGRLLKEDVLAHLAREPQRTEQPAATPSAAAPRPTSIAPAGKIESSSLTSGSPQRTEEVRPMSMIRRTIAARLVDAQQTAALLTTFNEVDMHPVMELRNKYKDLFLNRHGVKLGFMSFFAKAAVESLRRYPAVNAEIRGTNVIYRNYCDIGIAIGGGKGLVVPVVRNCEHLSFAEIERTIGEYAKAANENRLTPQDLEGGTFTISNGGVYGSMLSTPIVNPPQSGILGLHAIQDRPVARDGHVVIRPMMYLALTYDHRIVDGREAVSFLKTIKETIEEPARLFLEV